MNDTTLNHPSAPAPPSGTEGPAAGPTLTPLHGPAAPLTSDEAAWIREHAWPGWMRTMDGDYARGCFLFRMCMCELGACVSCSKPEPRHDLCLTRQHSGRPLGWDMSVWSWTAGRLAVHGRSVAVVTIAGRSCRWTCPCGCWRNELASAPNARPAPQTGGPPQGWGPPTTRAALAGGALVAGSAIDLGKGPAGLATVVFTVFGDPVGQGAIRYNPSGHGYHANGKTLKPWRAAIQQAACDVSGRHGYADRDKRKVCAICGVPKRSHGRFLGAVALDAVVVYAKPKSAPGRRFPIMQNLGDWDHHGRAVSDALTGVLYADDAQIVDGRVRQMYVGEDGCMMPQPGALIRVSEVSP